MKSNAANCPRDEDLLGTTIRNICFANANEYLGLELPYDSVAWVELAPPGSASSYVSTGTASTDHQLCIVPSSFRFTGKYAR